MATKLQAEPAPAGDLRPALYRVERRRRETRDTLTLALAPLDGEAVRPEPGQFTMLYAFGVGEIPVSSSGDPASPRLVHTVRAVGAVSRAIAAARPGHVLGVRGPFGNAWPVREAEGGDVVVVAGGIGLAPLRGALLHLLANRRAYGDVALLYGGRTPSDLLYRGELTRWRGRPDLELEVTVDAAGPEWLGHVGVVPNLVGRARFDPTSTVALVVGPEVMMRFAAVALLAAGVPAERIWVSLERHMRCGIGLCGHCQLGPELLCRDGPIYRWSDAAPLLGVREL